MTNSIQSQVYNPIFPLLWSLFSLVHFQLFNVLPLGEHKNFPATGAPRVRFFVSESQATIFFDGYPQTRSWHANNVVGGAGILVGGAAGIVRSATPVLFATASGFQCFAVGSTFWGKFSGHVGCIG